MRIASILPILAMAAGLWPIGAAEATNAPPSGQQPPATTTATAPTTAPATHQATNSAPRTGEQPQDKLICKKSEPKIGTRVGRRKVCMTAAQWRTVQEASRDYVDDIQSKARTYTVTP